jgi:MFS family permease
VLRDLRDGLDHVRKDRYLVSLVGFAAIYNLFAQWILVLFTVHAVRQLGMTAGLLGAVFSLGAIGAVVGAAAAPKAVRRWGAGPVLVACAAVECAALLALPAVGTDWPRPAVTAVLVLAFACNGAGTALSSVVALTIRQLRTPDRLLGRVNATMRWISYGVIAVGAALGGLVGDALGTRTAIAIGCAGSLSTLVWVACSPLRSIREPQDLRIADPVPGHTGDRGPDE